MSFLDAFKRLRGIRVYGPKQGRIKCQTSESANANSTSSPLSYHSHLEGLLRKYQNELKTPPRLEPKRYLNQAQYEAYAKSVIDQKRVQYQYMAEAIEEARHQIWPEPAVRVPDLVECIVGYRAWELDCAANIGGPSPFLKSPINNRHTWPFKEAMTGRCELAELRPQYNPNHCPPHFPCNCGIYATKTKHSIRFDNTGFVWGEVYLWGRVIEHESGWRAQYAYPKCLYVDWSPFPHKELIKVVAGKYGIQAI